MSFDPTKQIQVSVIPQSPQVVVYKLFYKQPQDTQETLFASGTDKDTTPYTVGPLASGSTLIYLVTFAGNPMTAYKLTIDATQNGSTLEATVITGTTDNSGVDINRQEVVLS